MAELDTLSGFDLPTELARLQKEYAGMRGVNRVVAEEGEIVFYVDAAHKDRIEALLKTNKEVVPIIVETGTPVSEF